jgi:hypothetical protein
MRFNSSTSFMSGGVTFESEVSEPPPRHRAGNELGNREPCCAENHQGITWRKETKVFLRISALCCDTEMF